MKKNKTLMGYVVVYAPEHPNAMKNANWSGYIYEHIKIATEHFGRILEDDEVVHHIDCSRRNNSVSNLVILSRKDHNKLHAEMRFSGEVYDLESQLKLIELNRDSYCECGSKLANRDGLICRTCTGILARKFEVSKEELEILVKEKPMTEIGKMFGVSDNAVKKRCKKLGIKLKSMRGHWMKVKARKI